MDQSVRIINVEDMQPKERSLGEAYAFSREELVPGDGSSPYGLRVYWLPPGKANYPYHYHARHDEVFYIISGNGTALTPQGEKPLRAGDVMICPPAPEGAHKITNTGEVPLVYLEVDTIAFPEVVHYPLSGGMGVLFGNRESNQFFQDDKRTTYLEISEQG